MNVIKIIFNISIIIIFLLIILLSIYSTLIPQEKTYALVYSPVYYIPWIIISILITVYPWIINLNLKSLINYFILHIPVILLLFTVIFSFLTSKSCLFSLYEGESINTNEIYKKLVIDKKQFEIIKLDKFEIDKHKNNKKIVKTYKSYLSVNNKNKIIMVNKPLKIDKIKIYQHSWELGLREIIISVNGNKYDIFSQNESPIYINDRFILNIYPEDIINKHDILYKWKIFDNNKLINSGEFTREKGYKNNVIDIKIIKEDYKLISIFNAVYRPMNIFLLIASIMFIISIFYNFWGYNILKK